MKASRYLQLENAIGIIVDANKYPSDCPINVNSRVVEIIHNPNLAKYKNTSKYQIWPVDKCKKLTLDKIKLILKEYKKETKRKKIIRTPVKKIIRTSVKF